MMTHMHHTQNIKHLMYPNEKYFNKVQVQYLSTWVNALSRRPSVVLLMFSSPGSVTVTAGSVRTRGGSTSPASLCILIQAARGKLWRGTFWTCCFVFCFISWCKCFYLWKEKLKANSWLSCVTKAAFACCVWEHDVHDAANSRYKCRCLNGPQLDFMNPRQKHLKTQRSGSSFH